MNHNFSENLAKLCRTAGRPERWSRSQRFRLGLGKSTSRRLTPGPLLWWAEGEETLTAISPAFATSIRGQTRGATQAYTNDTAPYGEQSIAAKGGQKTPRGREAAGVAPHRSRHRSRLLVSRLNNTSPHAWANTEPNSSMLISPGPPRSRSTPGITVVRFTIHSSRSLPIHESQFTVHGRCRFTTHESRFTIHGRFPCQHLPIQE